MKLTVRDLFWLTLVIALSLGWWVSVYKRKPVDEKSPHGEALALVLETQSDAIRAAEGDGSKNEAWWHDTMERTWTVERPFEPGFFDSRRSFRVSYQIDGKVSAEWNVDTREGRRTVTLSNQTQTDQ